MHIVVCIKQVPDSAQIRVHPVTNTIMRQGVPAIVNPYDLFALEEALRLKDEYGGRVTVLTMGPPMAEAALRKAISFGADFIDYLVYSGILSLRFSDRNVKKYTRFFSKKMKVVKSKSDLIYRFWLHPDYSRFTGTANELDEFNKEIFDRLKGMFPDENIVSR